MAEPYRRHSNGGTENLSYAVCQIPAKSDEDRYYCSLHENTSDLPSISSFGVFDGHGGHKASTKCAAELHNTIISNLNDLRSFASRDETLKYDFLDKAFCKAAIEASLKIDSEIQHNSTAGSTAVSIFILHRSDNYKRVLCSWIGDSRCVGYSVENDGTTSIIQMSQDHKPGLAREYLRIQNRENLRYQDVPIEVNVNTFQEETKEDDITNPKNQVAPDIPLGPTAGRAGGGDSGGGGGGTSIDPGLPQRSYIARRTLPNDINTRGPVAVFGLHGYSLTMTRSIGDSRGARSCVAQPDISALLVPPDKHMRFVLASDGMWDVMSSETVSKLCFQHKDPKKASLKLANAAWLRRIHRSMHMDDITVCVVDVNFHLFPVSAQGPGGCNCTIA